MPTTRDDKQSESKRVCVVVAVAIVRRRNTSGIKRFIESSHCECVFV